MVERVGILGGTFDPPHVGHLHISRIGLKKLKLNKLLWIITKNNPLKPKPYLGTKIRIKLSKEITRKEGKILMQQRDYSENLPFRGMWTFFGGTINKN